MLKEACLAQMELGPSASPQPPTPSPNLSLSTKNLWCFLNHSVPNLLMATFRIVQKDVCLGLAGALSIPLWTLWTAVSTLECSYSSFSGEEGEKNRYIGGHLQPAKNTYGEHPLLCQEVHVPALVSKNKTKHSYELMVYLYNTTDLLLSFYMWRKPVDSKGYISKEILEVASLHTAKTLIFVLQNGMQWLLWWAKGEVL